MSESAILSGTLLFVAAVLLLLPAPSFQHRSQRTRKLVRWKAEGGQTGWRRFPGCLSAPRGSGGPGQGSAGSGRRRQRSRVRGDAREDVPASEREAGEPARVDAAVLLDLTGALLTSGIGIEAALSRLASSVPGAEPLARVYASLSAGSDWEAAWNSLANKDANARALKEYGDCLSFAYATGAPTVRLLEISASQWRTGRRQEAERRAARLGVQMVLPLGACFLPALILLGVIPVVLGLLPGLLEAV